MAVNIDAIKRAIDDRRCVPLWYKGEGQRNIAPVLIGITQRGHPAILSFQMTGFTHSGFDRRRWRAFFTDDMQMIQDEEWMIKYAFYWDEDWLGYNGAGSTFLPKGRVDYVFHPPKPFLFYAVITLNETYGGLKISDNGKTRLIQLINTAIKGADYNVTVKFKWSEAIMDSVTLIPLASPSNFKIVLAPTIDTILENIVDEARVKWAKTKKETEVSYTSSDLSGYQINIQPANKYKGQMISWVGRKRFEGLLNQKLKQKFPKINYKITSWEDKQNIDVLGSGNRNITVPEITLVKDTLTTFINEAWGIWQSGFNNKDTIKATDPFDLYAYQVSIWLTDKIPTITGQERSMVPAEETPLRNFVEKALKTIYPGLSYTIKGWSTRSSVLLKYQDNTNVPSNIEHAVVDKIIQTINQAYSDFVYKQRFAFGNKENREFLDSIQNIILHTLNARK